MGFGALPVQMRAHLLCVGVVGENSPHAPGAAGLQGGRPIGWADRTASGHVGGSAEWAAKPLREDGKEELLRWRNPALRQDFLDTG